MERTDEGGSEKGRDQEEINEKGGLMGCCEGVDGGGGGG